MSDIHIDDFHKDLSKILIQLYNNFPRKVLLLVEDIAGADTPDEFGLHSERHQACFSTIIWLTEANYITYAETVRQDAVDQATLTHKAFTLLSTLNPQAPNGEPSDEASTPASIKEAQSSNINILRQALKSGSSHRIQQTVQALLQQSRYHS